MNPKNRGSKPPEIFEFSLQRIQNYLKRTSKIF